MVNELDVFDALKHLTDVSDNNYQQTLDLCRQCFESLKKELKNDAEPSDPRVINAAAANAFYMLCLKEKNASGDGVTSFKAGDVSITQESADIDGKIKVAEAFCERTGRRLIPLLEDSGFFAGKIDI